MKAKKKSLPLKIEPMLATLVTEPVNEAGWVYELKWDGFRALAYLNGKETRLLSRNHKSFNEKYYPLLKELQQWDADAVVDGELVVVNNNGVADFSLLQQWRSEADGELVYYVFDVLWANGKSTMNLELSERKKILEKLMPVKLPMIRQSMLFKNSGDEAFRLAQKLQLEGIMAKKLDSLYEPGARSKYWLKVKTEKMQELIIGGYTINEGTNKLFSALLLGIMENGAFKFVTPVGTGFNRKMQEEIIQLSKPFTAKVSPFDTVPEFNKPSRFRPHPPKAEVVWIKPRLVVEIAYRERTSSGAIRQPSFRGLRPDKNVNEVVMENEKNTADVLAHANLKKQKLVTAPGKKERKSLLNPNEESQTRIINGNELHFTNLGKIYWPKEKYTKRDMINYYFQVAPFMLPYMKDRPQILNRHPHGIKGESFYQKDVKGKAPEWIETFPYYSYMDQREKEFLVCTHEASLLYIASLGCIEMNPWHSRRSKPDHPDWCIIDLDPDKNTFDQVIKAAQVTHELLDSIGVQSLCKTSGSTGLHIYIPMGAKYTYEDSKEFGRKIAKLVHQELPKFTSIERKTSDRGRKMYIDFLQNRPQASVAAPYSLRPKPGATVSMPLVWEEVKKGLKIKDFHMGNAVARIKETGDLFKPVLGKGIDLKKALMKIDALMKED